MVIFEALDLYHRSRFRSYGPVTTITARLCQLLSMELILIFTAVFILRLGTLEVWSQEKAVYIKLLLSKADKSMCKFEYSLLCVICSFLQFSPEGKIDDEEILRAF